MLIFERSSIRTVSMVSLRFPTFPHACPIILGQVNLRERQNRPGRSSDAPNMCFKVGSKAGHRRSQGHNWGLRWVGIAYGPLQSAIRHHITLFRDPAWSYFGAPGSTRKLISLGHPGAAQALASQTGPGSRLDAPNGAFQVGLKVGH